MQLLIHQLSPSHHSSPHSIHNHAHQQLTPHHSPPNSPKNTKQKEAITTTNLVPRINLRKEHLRRKILRRTATRHLRPMKHPRMKRLRSLRKMHPPRRKHLLKESRNLKILGLLLKLRSRRKLLPRELGGVLGLRSRRRSRCLLDV